MKLKITVGDKTATATLYDNPASRDFVTMLPLTLALEDYVNTEKIGYLPRTLTTHGTSVKDVVGDFAYYAPWGNLAIFYKGNATQTNSLFILGKIDSGKEVFQVSGSLSAKIERMK